LSISAKPAVLPGNNLPLPRNSSREIVIFVLCAISVNFAVAVRLSLRAHFY
jgi:hypothetical protein